MPKLTPETEKQRAKSLSKAYIKSGLNQTRLAKKEGVTSQAINQRLQRKSVQDALTKYLDSKKIRSSLKKAAIDGLKANKVIGYLHQYKRIGEGEKPERLQPDEVISNEFLEVPDHNVRFKFWHDLMTAIGHLKANGRNGLDVHIHLSIEQKKEKVDWLNQYFRGLPAN